MNSRKCQYLHVLSREGNTVRVFSSKKCLNYKIKLRGRTFFWGQLCKQDSTPVYIQPALPYVILTMLHVYDRVTLVLQSKIPFSKL